MSDVVAKKISNEAIALAVTLSSVLDGYDSEVVQQACAILVFAYVTLNDDEEWRVMTGITMDKAMADMVIKRREKVTG